MALLPVFALAEIDEADGLLLTPKISWSKGDHRCALHLNSKIHYEHSLEQGRVLAAHHWRSVK
jgi:hypothetical protein